MDYSKRLKYHYQPKQGWLNDPNGLVYFKGYYHIFYQYAPNHQMPFLEPMCWGHARTKDFITFEELPVTLTPDKPYDKDGCFSGTAIVKDDILYFVYSSIIKLPEPNEIYTRARIETVSIAYSSDGINFTKFEGNPVINGFPADGGCNFRDPAVLENNGKYYVIMASGQPEKKLGRLLAYKSDDLLNWEYVGIAKEREGTLWAECPSFMQYGDEFMLASSYLNPDRSHSFSVGVGDFDGKTFTERLSGKVDLGPDQYAGQGFTDHLGRNIMITWLPGWKYRRIPCVGCMSLPRELTVKDGKVYGYPVKEVQHLLKDSDSAVEITEKGFVINRKGRAPVVYEGEINDIKILRDEYVVEVFLNGGERIYTALL